MRLSVHVYCPIRGISRTSTPAVSEHRPRDLRLRVQKAGHRHGALRRAPRAWNGCNLASIRVMPDQFMVDHIGNPANSLGGARMTLTPPPLWRLMRAEEAGRELRTARQDAPFASEPRPPARWAGPRSSSAMISTRSTSPNRSSPSCARSRSRSRSGGTSASLATDPTRDAGSSRCRKGRWSALRFARRLVDGMADARVNRVRTGAICTLERGDPSPRILLWNESP